MHNFACPSCGADVAFRSPALPVRVCDQCRTLVVRYNASAQAMGMIADLPFDVSPVQIGTQGQWQGQGFHIIGRVRWSRDDGAWNEWLMLMADGSHGWLGEAMGQYMAMREMAIKAPMAKVLRRLIDGETVLPGETATIAAHDYQVADIRTVTCVAGEGELPFSAPTGWQALSVDFRNADGRCASFQKDSRDHALYVGEYVTLADLHPRNLRPLPGWTMPSYAR
jgi:hypothetical protein